MDGNTEFLHEFFAGAEEHLDALEQAIIGLDAQEATGVDVRAVAELSTLLQELKNGAGFLGLTKFFTLAEAGEPLLGALAAGAVPLTTPVVDGLLQLTETLKELLVLTKGQADDSAVMTEDLRARLAALAAGEGVEETLAEVPMEVPTDDVTGSVVLAEQSWTDVAPGQTKPPVKAMPAKPVAGPLPPGVVVGPLLRRSSGQPAAWQAATLERRLQNERRGHERRSGTRRGADNGAVA